MARTAESYLALREDLELALDHVVSQYDELRKTVERAEHEFASDDPMAWSAVGFMLHNLRFDPHCSIATRSSRSTSCTASVTPFEASTIGASTPGV